MIDFDLDDNSDGGMKNAIDLAHEIVERRLAGAELTAFIRAIQADAIHAALMGVNPSGNAW